MKILPSGPSLRRMEPKKSIFLWQWRGEESSSRSGQSLEAELSQEEEYNSREECEPAYTHEASRNYIQGAKYYPFMEYSSRFIPGYTCLATSESESSPLPTQSIRMREPVTVVDRFCYPVPAHMDE